MTNDELARKIVDEAMSEWNRDGDPNSLCAPVLVKHFAAALRAANAALVLECNAWRACEHLRRGEPHAEFRDLSEARARVDALGLLKG